MSGFVLCHFADEYIEFVKDPQVILEYTLWVLKISLHLKIYVLWFCLMLLSIFLLVDLYGQIVGGTI